MSTYFSKRIKYAKIFTASNFKFRKKYKAERYFKLGKLLFIGIAAWFLSEKAFLLDHLNSAGITVLAIVLYYIFWFFINFFKTPSIMDARLRRIIKEKERMYKRQDFRDKKFELACKLKSIKDSYKDPLLHSRNLIDKSNPIFEKVIIALKESKIVTPHVIDCFENGQRPFMRLGDTPLHENIACGLILNSLMNCDEVNFI